MICDNAIILDVEKLKMGKNCRIDSFTLINCKGGVEMDDYSCIHAGAKVVGDGGMLLGKGSVIEYNAVIVTSTSKTLSHMGTMVPKEYKRILKGKVKIGEEVFIGIGSVIMPGVKIGDRAVIGANSYISHDVPKDTIIHPKGTKNRSFTRRFRYD